MTETEDIRLRSAIPGPGNMLTKARTELGMSVEDVAAELRLSPRQISALEKDDYHSLPGPTYVRGYLRNYARLLGLPESEVIPESRPTAIDDDDAPSMSEAEIRSAMKKLGINKIEL